ncbi:MAG TPA: UDP-N-acetylglucosamine 2-epimerase (non-hydrolyzing) [Isosphaeraceae bacterium]|jgi:UDP-N-acetylglucosamine 2-epimerase (non-hydrolysing)|nr:UDP-N-acetylglucosamine 2-epimerase (non-hydrolyzing) [Isosphaeraceae bacterium]
MGCAVVCVVGTRPEAVKMAPVVLRLRREGSGFAVRLVTTGQHRELLDRALADFGLASDDDLDVMRPGQSLPDLTARALVAVGDALGRHRPDIVLAQGDTTTVLCAALASYYRQIPFCHVEAGLRTGLPYAPFPEEKNRVLAAHLATIHFAPTAAAKANLLAEGIDTASVHVTGNTVIDALLMISRQPVALPVAPPTERFVLVTAHRREHFGSPLEQICLALCDLLDRNPGLSVIYPVHPNPNVREVVTNRLGGHDRIRLIDPVGYREFVALMKAAFAILTDSGGVQEEGPSLGKPVLLLREATERPEAVSAGTVRLVGPNREAIVAAIEELHHQPEVYEQFARVANPYGDGWASERIARVLAARFGLDPGQIPEGMPEGLRSQ